MIESSKLKHGGFSDAKVPAHENGEWCIPLVVFKRTQFGIISEPLPDLSDRTWEVFISQRYGGTRVQVTLFEQFCPLPHPMFRHAVVSVAKQQFGPT